MIIIWILLYLMIGFVSVAAYFEYMGKVEEDEPTILILLMWPLVLVMVVFFAINEMLTKFFRKFMNHKKDKKDKKDKEE